MPRTSGTRIGRGAGKGDGWGGDAKGPGNAPLKPKGDLASDRIRAERNSRSAAVVKDAAERLRLVKDRIFDLAMQAEREETQLSAAVAYANREEGMPVQKNINENTVVRTVIRAPAAPRDFDEWQAQHSPKALNS